MADEKPKTSQNGIGYDNSQFRGLRVTLFAQLFFAYCGWGL